MNNNTDSDTDDGASSSSDDSDDYEDDGSMDDISMDEEESAAERQRERDEEMHRIETSDPSLTTLCIYPAMADDWGVLGTAIGRNSQLSELVLHDCTPNIPAIEFRNFARGLAFNRSIQKLKIAYGWTHSDHEAWEHLTRFFIDNEAFESLEINYYLNVGNHRELISALQSFVSLNSFIITNGYAQVGRPGYGYVSADEVIVALIGHHTGLKKLTITGMDMERGGCAALATSSLAELHLQYGVHINEEGARAFANGLARNATLKVLEIIHSSEISDIAWQSIFTAFSTCKVKSLILNFNGLTDATVQSLSNALLHNTTLKSLSLQDKMITNAGWVILSTSLRGIMLNKLDIGRNLIGDIAINALTNALLNNSMLKTLSCYKNPAVTPAGWMNLSTILRNPTSALEVIYVGDNSINDEVIYSFADALANNNKLRKLNVGDISESNITSAGYAAITNVLCDTSSILNTFNSNHTLEELCHKSFARPLPNDLLSLFKINRESSVSQAARIKIIKTHFSGSEINMQPFMEMNLSVRPHAIAWMAKDLHLYELLRAMPSLLE